MSPKTSSGTLGLRETQSFGVRASLHAQALITEPSMHQPELELLVTKACQGEVATRLSPRGAKKRAASCVPSQRWGVSVGLTPTSLSPSGLLPSSTVHVLLIRSVSESFNVPAVSWVLPH